MRFRAFLVAVPAALVAVAVPNPHASASEPASAAVERQIRSTGSDDTSPDGTPRPTVNEFMPEERPLSDCLGALPKPNCGSEARGGRAQTTVFVVLLGGLAFIAWRIVAGSRRARTTTVSSDRTPGATTVPDDDGGGPTP